MASLDAFGALFQSRRKTMKMTRFGEVIAFAAAVLSFLAAANARLI